MLEKLPSVVGRALRGARPGMEKIASEAEGIREAPEVISVTSNDFSEGQRLPVQFSADGDASSPSLRWRGVPENAQEVVLLVEDPDAPSKEPFVHAIVVGLPRGDGGFGTGELSIGGDYDFGKNSALRAAYMPPDPPPGHGVHRYVFQVFALDVKPKWNGAVGRSALLKEMRGHVLARGSLVGTYERK